MKTTALLVSLVLLTFGVGGLLVGRAEKAATPDVARPVTRVDLDRSAAPNVYDVLKQLRPDWLVAVPEDGGDRATVYIEAHCTRTTCLRWVESDHVEEVHYAAPAADRPSWIHPEEGGVIVVKLRHLPAQRSAVMR